jgi:hypothetical protein
MLQAGTRVFRYWNKSEIGYVLGQHKYGFNIVWWPNRKWGEGRYTAESDELLSACYEDDELGEREWL